MSRRARQRRDRRVLINPVAYAIESASRLPAADRLKLQGIIEQALREFTRGIDCATHWRTMADALNTAEQLAGLGIASSAENRTWIMVAQRVLADVAQRQAERGSWTLRGPELQALDDGIYLAKLQLDFCTLGEFERARRAVAERTRHALAGNVAAGVLMVEVAA